MTSSLRKFPGRDTNRTVLYAIGFEDGRVKFGVSIDPKNRLSTIARDERTRVVWAHLFGRIPAAPRGSACPAELAVRREAIAAGAERIGYSEFFAGLTREKAIHCGRLARAAEGVCA